MLGRSAVHVSDLLQPYRFSFQLVCATESLSRSCLLFPGLSDGQISGVRCETPPLIATASLWTSRKYWTRQQRYPPTMAMTQTQEDAPLQASATKTPESYNLPSAKALKAAGEVQIQDEDGQKFAFKELYQTEGERTLIIFVRHFFCGVRPPSNLKAAYASSILNGPFALPPSPYDS